jgi:hypothetical protein
VSVRVNTTSGARRERWLVPVILALTLVMASVGGLACKSNGTELSENTSIPTVGAVLPDNSSTTTMAGYIQVEVRPAEIVAERGQSVHIWCFACPIVDTPVTIVSIDVAFFDASALLLREQRLGADEQRPWESHTAYRIVGDEASYRLLIVYDLGKFLDNPGTRYSEYTVASMPITITK